MMSEDDKAKALSGDHHHHHPPPPPQPQPQQYPPPQYGTFQGVSNYPPEPQPAIGFPQPVPPPGAIDPSVPPYYGQGYQAIPSGMYDLEALFIGSLSGAMEFHGFRYLFLCAIVSGYAIAEGRPVRERRLPCCGLGCGWCLFIIGFFLVAIPWYLGAMIMLCSRIDYREKPGYIACTIAAVLATIAIIIGATKGADDW
ncbi:60S ribosomal protein L18a-like protein [Senna tora]|uniref:60S ribosomal protein L18a-like protein n=1 Tax=Senna tora TaxID=362788 RepID=A0A834X1P8_9FABA|nr:60S ribosomal protein L18a-like protein [Senna tora]